MKKFIAVSVFVMLVLAGCDLTGPLFDPIVGTWEVSVLGVTTTIVFNSDRTSTTTQTVLGIGVSSSGTWASDGSTITRSWTGESDVIDFYSFNSNRSAMTLSPEAGGLAATFTRL